MAPRHRTIDDRLRRFVLFVALSTTCSGCDRLTKDAAIDGLRGSDPIALVAGVILLMWPHGRSDASEPRAAGA